MTDKLEKHILRKFEII